MSIVPVQASGQAGDRQDANARLSSALIRLNRNPHDTEALTAAGNAALATGDTDAAVGFLPARCGFPPIIPRSRPAWPAPKCARKTRSAPFRCLLRRKKACRQQKAGSFPPELLGDRGLAYDLIGDNANAQQYYRQALASGPASDVSAEVSRRLALSLAIGGDRKASETVLSTLLQKQDRAAWRARIFALAILGL